MLLERAKPGLAKSASLCAAIVLALTVAAGGAAGAATGMEGLAPHYIQLTNKHTTSFVAAAEVLKGKPEVEWTDQEIQHYLANALWAVYSAVFTYMLLEGELPDDPRAVVEDGHLSVWPQNPWNDWSDMVVNAEGLNFSPGNLSLQLCPPSEYSYAAGGAREVPHSFEMGVFGPTPEFASNYGNAQPYEKNRSWAQTPGGTLYMIGVWAETAASLRERREQLKETHSEL